MDIKKLTIKMRIVKSVEFEEALNACRQAFGLLIMRKRVNVYVYAFSIEDAIFTREYLEQFGSKYAGRCKV